MCLRDRGKASKIDTAAVIPVVFMNVNYTTKIYNVLNGESVGTKFIP